MSARCSPAVVDLTMYFMSGEKKKKPPPLASENLASARSSCGVVPSAPSGPMDAMYASADSLKTCSRSHPHALGAYSLKVTNVRPSSPHGSLVTASSVPPQHDL